MIPAGIAASLGTWPMKWASGAGINEMFPNSIKRFMHLRAAATGDRGRDQHGEDDQIAQRKNGGESWIALRSKIATQIESATHHGDTRRVAKPDHQGRDKTRSHTDASVKRDVSVRDKPDLEEKDAEPD